MSPPPTCFNEINLRLPSTIIPSKTGPEYSTKRSLVITSKIIATFSFEQDQSTVSDRLVLDQTITLQRNVELSDRLTTQFFKRLVVVGLVENGVTQVRPI
jgi:hypothetical protein